MPQRCDPSLISQCISEAHRPWNYYYYSCALLCSLLFLLSHLASKISQAGPPEWCWCWRPGVPVALLWLCSLIKYITIWTTVHYIVLACLTSSISEFGLWDMNYFLALYFLQFEWYWYVFSAIESQTFDEMQVRSWLMSHATLLFITCFIQVECNSLGVLIIVIGCNISYELFFSAFTHLTRVCNSTLFMDLLCASSDAEAGAELPFSKKLYFWISEDHTLWAMAII